MSLRDRCREIANKLQRDAILRQNDPVQTILEFVVAEIGRSADPSLEDSLPLVLYFQTPADRDEFVAAVKESKPTMIVRSLP